MLLKRKQEGLRMEERGKALEHEKKRERVSECEVFTRERCGE